MTLELFDGARVKLRNGDEHIVTKSNYTGSPFVWMAYSEDGIKLLRSWRTDGAYTNTDHSDHPLDVVDIIADKAPETDSLKTFPYDATFEPEPGTQYILRNGEARSNLLFFQDEIHTSQRDEVWTRLDGKCRVLSRKVLMAMQNAGNFYDRDFEKALRDHDIVRVAFPAVKRVVMMDENGQTHPDMPIPETDECIEYRKDHTEEERTWIAVSNVIEQQTKGVKLTWDKPVTEDEISHFTVYRSGDNTKHRIDEDGYMWVTPPPEGNWRENKLPRRRLLKTMIAVAEGLGGEFGSWSWGEDPSSIRFSVLFSSSKRSGGYVGYEKWVTLSLTDDEKNAMLPMRDRK